MGVNIPVGADLRLKGVQAFLGGMGRAADAAKRAEHHTGRLGAGLTAAGQGFRHVGRGAQRVAGSLASVGKVLGAVTLGLGAGLGAAVAKFGEFELGMARIGTLLPAERSAMADFGDTVNRMSVQFGRGAAEMSDAVFQAISAGVDPSTASVKAFSDVVGKAATGGFVNMATVVDGLTTVMNAYGLQTKDATTVSDAFFVANKLGKTTFDELSKSIGRVAPTARALGISYQEILAATVSLTKGGIKTSEVMSGLKAILANVAQPGAAATKQAKELGLQFNLEALQAKGLSGFLEDLVAKTRGNTIAQNKLFGSVEAFNAVARLASQEGLADFRGALKEITTTSGATQQAFDRVASTTGHKLAQMKEGFAAMVRELGGGIATGLGLDKIGDVPTAVQGASETIRGAAASFAEAFRRAFDPVKAAGETDWKGMASSIGNAAAEMGNAFISALKLVPQVVAGLSAIAQGISMTTASIRLMMGQATANPSDRWKKTAGTEVAAGKESYAHERLRKTMGGLSGSRLTRIAGGAASDVIEKIARETRWNAENLAAGKAMRRELWAEEERAARANRAIGSGGLADVGGAAFAQSFKRAAGPRTEVKLPTEGRMVVNLYNKMEAELNGKKKPGRGGGGHRFSARGRGNATIESTSRFRFLLYDDEIWPMSDSFNFASFLTERTS